MSSLNDELFNESDGFGEKITRNRLIVMDEVFGLADKSKKFASFLTITHASTFFTLSIQKNQFGERFVPRLTF